MRSDGKRDRKIYWLLGAFLLITLGLPFVRVRLVDYFLSVLTFAFIYTTLAQSWNLLGGFAKQFSLGHAAFFGLGAFLTAFCCNIGIPAPLSLAIAAIAVAIFSLPLGLICFSAKGPYFTIITLAAAEILRIIFLWRPELSGSEGMVLPYGLFSNNIATYYLTMALAGASIWVAYLLEKSDHGLALRAIGDDEEASAELGVRVRHAKSSTLGISAALGALAGGAYGLFTQYLSPNDVFSIIYSLDAIFICIIGGIGMPFGPLLGALLFSILEETLNPLLPGSHLLFLGFILIIIMFLLPNGLLSLAFKSQTRGKTLKVQRRGQEVSG